MPPQKQACETILKTQISIVKIIKRVREISQKLKSLLENKAKLKYGIVNLLDVMSAETISAISSAAGSIAKSMLGSVSGMASTLLESILSSILKILLANPTAIFSLVAIPHKEAVKAANEERKLLREARRNMRTILYIILKWTQGIGGSRYYEQLKTALPYIQEAIFLSIDIITELEGDPSEESGARNAVFNETKYRQMQFNLEQAISITKPDSIVDTKFQITKKVEQNRDKRYKELKEKIDSNYKKSRKELSLWYSNQSALISKNSESLKNALEEEKLRHEYAIKRNVLDTEYKEKLHAAELEATAQAAIDKSTYFNAIGGIAAEFSNDINNLGNNLAAFVENLKDAYSAYIRSQALCNAIYDIRNLITNLINEIIDMLRKTSNASASAAIKSIETAQSLMEVAEEDFSENVARYETPSAKISSTELATTVSTGYGLLSSADALLDGTITQSLADLINSDDVLQFANDDFEKFYKALEQIPDWDGEVGVWAVSPTDSKISPYIQMIADAITVLAKVPPLAISNDEDDRREIANILKSLNNTFKVLLNHNSVVLNTLNSYTPYMSSEAGNLSRILANAGLLENFATGMSIAAVTADIVTSIIKGGLDDTMPTYANCRAAYPDLYNNAEAAEAAALANACIPPSEIDLNFIATIEENEGRLIGARSYIDNWDMNAEFTQKDFNELPPDTFGSID